MLNNDKFELLFNTMNKKYLPLMYSFVFCRVFIVLVDFRLHCVTTVTPFIRRSQGWSLRSGRDPGRVAPKTVLFRGNSNPLQLFQLQPKKETSSSSLHYRLEKSFILSLPNRTICAVLRAHLAFVSSLWPPLRLPANLHLKLESCFPHGPTGVIWSSSCEKSHVQVR